MIKILSRERCFVGAPLYFAERITAHEALPNTSYWRGFYFWRMPMERVWRFGSAPEQPETPYVTWQIISGDSNSSLDSRPVSDSAIVQIDVYATDEDVVDQVAEAIRFAIELDCYVVRYGEADKDPVTGMPHYSFDVSWIVNRE